MRQFCYSALGSLPPLSTTVGGVVAQEALISLTGKFSPLCQWVSFSSISCMGHFLPALILGFKFNCHYYYYIPHNGVLSFQFLWYDIFSCILMRVRCLGTLKNLMINFPFSQSEFLRFGWVVLRGVVYVAVQG